MKRTETTGARLQRQPLTQKVAQTAIFTALGIVFAHLFYFPFLGTLAFPGQHLVNATAGVILGPWWAALIAVLVGMYRNALGIGTIFAFPGGIPGALVVGGVYWLLRRRLSRRVSLVASLFEPVGTVLIGATLSLLVVAPMIGDVKKLGLIQQFGVAGALLQFYWGWAISSVVGAVAGYLVLLGLDRFGLVKR